MLKKVEFETRNLMEAEKRAVEELRLPLNKIKFTVLKEKRGILGIGASTTYEAKADVNLVLEGKAYLENIFKNLDIEVQMEMRANEDGSEVHYHINSEENALLIGRDGRTLKSIQLLLRNYLNIYTTDLLIVNLDIANYNQNRQKQLEILATKTAKQVARTGKQVKLNPMNAYERRIIHAKLSDWRDVETESIGVGEDRQLVIKPSKNK